MSDRETTVDRLLAGGRRRLPMIHQSETAECGLACLAMIAAWHGYQQDLPGLRGRADLSGRGTTLKQLVAVAASIGLASRPLRLELEGLQHLQCPCVLHWGLDHFVVLRECRGGRLVLHDPGCGVRRVSLGEAGEKFSGIALELTPGEAFQPRRERRRLALSDLWDRVPGLARSLVTLLFLTLALQVFVLAAPLYLQTVIDDAILRSDAGLLQVLALGFSLLLLIEAATRWLRESVVLHLSSRLQLQLGMNLFHHLVRLPASFFQRRHMGDVLSRFGSLDAVRDALGNGLVSGAVDGIMTLLALAVLLMYAPLLTGIVLLALTAYLLLRLALFGPVRRATETMISEQARSETSLMETLRAMPTVKLQQKESARETHWVGRFAGAINQQVLLGRYRLYHDVGDTLLFGLENIAVVYLAALSIMAGNMTPGMLFAFMSYKRHFTRAALGLVEQCFTLRLLGLHLERLADIAFAEREALPVQPNPSPLHRGGNSRGVNLVARKLAYRFQAGEPAVFEGLNLEVAAGEMLAIRGASGAGKSTLLKCLMGLLTPEGVLSVDGEPATAATGYRACIGAVLQDDRLLSGSIADNIGCFDERPDMSRLYRCAQLACIHEDILRMPMRYNTPVGDMGNTLSGGQVQRIMLARALYRQPRILFLDEATSHLDPDREAEINGNIRALSMTRVVVAHRAESIALADRVLDLDALRKDRSNACVPTGN